MSILNTACFSFSERPSITEASTVGASSTAPEENVTTQVHVEDDLLWEEDSEVQTENINSSNVFAITEPSQIKNKEDKSPLVKLRNNYADLGDDASEYDR